MKLLSQNSVCDVKYRSDIAKQAGYKKDGGAITYGIQLLEFKGYVKKVGDKRWKIT